MEDKILNNSLLNACINDYVDLNIVKNLLNKGADPLGYFNNDINDDTVIDEILSNYIDSLDNDPTIENIFKLFIKHGLKINHQKEGDLLLYDLRFLSEKHAINLLDIIKDHCNLLYFNNLISDCYCDSTMILEEDECVIKYIRILMYLISFNYLKENIKLLREFFEIDKNNYDFTKFRNPFNYVIHLDVTQRRNEFSNQGTVVYIVDKKYDKVVCKFTLD